MKDKYIVCVKIGHADPLTEAVEAENASDAIDIVSSRLDDNIQPKYVSSMDRRYVCFLIVDGNCVGCGMAERVT